jgi:hypothetical protein
METRLTFQFVYELGLEMKITLEGQYKLLVLRDPLSGA